MCLSLTETSSQQYTDHTYLLLKTQKPAEECNSHTLSVAPNHIWLEVGVPIVSQ